MPYTLPGETVTIERDGQRARLVSVDAPSPRRERPSAPISANAAAARLQHMRHGFYQDWKRDTLVHTLKQARIEGFIEPLIDAHGEDADA